jgi:hypothetical protein
MKYKFQFLLIICSYSINLTGSISVVYNLRIAETSKHPAQAHPTSASCTLFGTFREQYSTIKQRAGGGLFTLMYTPENFFLRVDAAVAHVTSLFSDSSHVGRTQTDDLLFSAGYSPNTPSNMRMTFSGILGLPTHRDTSLNLIQFGIGHYGLGTQFDGSLFYSEKQTQSLRYAARFIHFFPRSVYIQALDCQKFSFNIGNLVDLLIAFHSLHQNHSGEIGYNATFLFDASLHPTLNSVIAQIDYIRNSFYVVYKNTFLIGENNHTCALALSYGFDVKETIFSNKHIVTLWTSWTISF